MANLNDSLGLLSSDDDESQANQSEREENLSDDNDNQGVDDLASEELDTASSLQQFIEDDNKVTPTKRMTYVLMLAYQNISAFDIMNGPYSSFVSRSGWKTKFKFTKGMVAQEMKRRDPDARPNVSNSTIDQMMARLMPLENTMDKQYVVQKESEYRARLSIEIRQQEEEDEQNSPAARMSPADRMRFALLFDVDELYSAYLRSQDCLTRPQIDAGQSGAGTDFWELALQYLND